MTCEVVVDSRQFIKAVGKAIAAQRARAGLTQGQVAERLGVEKETISRMETGVIQPTLSRLHQFSVLFNCPVHHFFWTDQGGPDTQADTIADMLRNLPEEKRTSVVRLVAEMVRVLS